MTREKNFCSKAIRPISKTRPRRKYGASGTQGGKLAEKGRSMLRPLRGGRGGGGELCVEIGFKGVEARGNGLRGGEFSGDGVGSL